MKNLILALKTSFILSAASLCAEGNPIEKINTVDAPAVYDIHNPVDYLSSIRKSQAISVDLEKTKKLVFVSGQVAIDPVTGQEQESDIHIATNRTLDNVEAILKAAGSGWEYVVRVDIFLRDLSDWQGMNEEYAKRFPNGIYPARQTVGVNMVNRIEISCVAIVPKE